MELIKFVSHLQKKLAGPLPGKNAHFDMIPSARLREFDPIPETARKSAVMILLFERNNNVNTLLILRPAYEGVHSSQISFPGGSYNDEDMTLENTALRETEEETGVDRNKIKIIGSLTELYIPPSNFLVKPFIGFTEDLGQLIPDKTEVERIFEVDISDLVGDKNIKTKKIRIRNGQEFETPYYDVSGETVWGATAMIIREFSEICKDHYSTE